MGNLQSWIKAEWEIAVLVATVVVMILAGLWAMLCGNDDDGVRKQSLGLWRRPPLVNESGFSFLDKNAGTAMENVRPFGLPERMILKDEVKETVKASPKAVPATVVAPAEPQIKEAEPWTPEVSEAPTVPAPAAPKAMVGSVYFADVQELADGTPVAVLELVRGTQRIIVTLAQGETKYGCRLTALTGKSVTLVDANRRIYRLSRDSEVRLWTLEQQH